MSRPVAQRLLRRAVCPSAPFLLPLRSYGPSQGAWGLVSTSQTARRCMASKSKRRKSRAKVLQTEAAQETKLQDELETILDFRAELASFQLHSAMRLYPRAIKTQLLEGKDTRELARLLHNTYRSTKSLEKEQKEALAAQVETLVEDLKQHRLPPDPIASLHLISYFKDSQQFDLGLEFWKWLLQQDEECADARTYGAAIEMLAYQGVPLDVLEKLYQYALKRFPGGYSEYHLSPDAILADRSQPIAMSGTRMSLLQGILTARILHGDWQGAYLGMDVAFRLHPTQVPQRFFELFIYERPLSEAYKVFLLACRCGVVLKPNLLNITLEGLVRAQEFETTLARKLDLVSAMLNAVRAYAGAGGTLDSLHLSVLVRNLASLIPPSDTLVGQAEPDKVEESEIRENSHVNLIYDLFESVMDIFAQIGIYPTIGTFNSIISIGGDLQRQDLIDLAITALHSSEQEPTAVTYRALVTAAGEMQDEESVKDAWALLQDAALLRADKAAAAANIAPQDMEQPKLDKLDWKVLARAGRRVNDIAFVREQLQKGVFAVDETVLSLIERELGRDERRSSKELKTSESQAMKDTNIPITDASHDGNMDVILPRVSTITSQLSQIREIYSSGKLLDFYHTPIRMGLDEDECVVFASDPLSSDPGANDELRAVYDKFTTDTYSQSTSLPASDLPLASSLEGSEVDADTEGDAAAGAVAGADDAVEIESIPQAKPRVHYSSTQFPLSELRFANWISIHELLYDAKLNERVKQDAVDVALGQGKPLERGRTAEWRCYLGLRRAAYSATVSESESEMSQITDQTVDHGKTIDNKDGLSRQGPGWAKLISDLRQWRKEES